MLFISRYSGYDYYGVVDTDDDTEGIVNVTALRKACLDGGLEIRGANPDITEITGLHWLREDKIFVYQPPETRSQLQIKTRVLKHVDVTMYRSMITRIKWDIFAIHTPVTIRLSDFGTSCADFILTGAKEVDEHKVTIILDEKIDFSNMTFKLRFYGDGYIDIERIGMKLDIRELDWEKARILYTLLYDGFSAEIPSFIIDSEERMKYVLSRSSDPSFWVPDCEE